MTGVDGNQAAYSSSRDNLNDEVGSDVDQNDDLVKTGVDANHSVDQQPAQDGEVGSDVDQNADTVMRGVSANRSAASPGQNDPNGEVNSEIHGGEKEQQNSHGEHNHSNQSGAQSMSTADMTDSNSSDTNHSIPSLAQGDLKGEPETNAHQGNKSQPKSEGQKNSHDSTSHSDQSGIAKGDGAHHMKHGSKNSSVRQTNRSSLSHVDNLSTTEPDYQGGNHTNITAEETTEVFSFHSILAILAAVLSLMCASVCMAVSCFWRGSDKMMKEKGGCWGVEDSETEAILLR